MTNFSDVQDFHNKFDVPVQLLPSLPSEEVWEFRRKFLEEELQEIKDAYAEQDLAKFADGLIDLVYVAMGTADMCGIPWQELWDEVQRANMSKERATSAEQSTRKTTLDVIKPAGWTPPDIEGVLKRVAEEREHSYRHTLADL